MQLVRSPDLQPISIYRPVCSGFRTLSTDASINIRLHTRSRLYLTLRLLEEECALISRYSICHRDRQKDP